MNLCDYCHMENCPFRSDKVKIERLQMNTEIMRRSWARDNEEHDKRIAELEEALVGERAWWAFACSEGGLNYRFLSDFRNGSKGDFDKSWLKESREQLRQEKLL